MYVDLAFQSFLATLTHVEFVVTSAATGSALFASSRTRAKRVTSSVPSDLRDFSSWRRAFLSPFVQAVVDILPCFVERLLGRGRLRVSAPEARLPRVSRAIPGNVAGEKNTICTTMRRESSRRDTNRSSFCEPDSLKMSRDVTPGIVTPAYHKAFLSECRALGFIFALERGLLLFLWSLSRETWIGAIMTVSLVWVGRESLGLLFACASGVECRLHGPKARANFFY